MCVYLDLYQLTSTQTSPNHQTVTKQILSAVRRPSIESKNSGSCDNVYECAQTCDGQGLLHALIKMKAGFLSGNFLMTNPPSHCKEYQQA